MEKITSCSQEQNIDLPRCLNIDTRYFLCLDLLATELISDSYEWTLPHFLITLFHVVPKSSKLSHKVKYFTLFAQASFSFMISKCNFNCSSPHVQLLIRRPFILSRKKLCSTLTKCFNACFV